MREGNIELELFKPLAKWPSKVYFNQFWQLERLKTYKMLNEYEVVTDLAGGGGVPEVCPGLLKYVLIRDYYNFT